MRNHGPDADEGQADEIREEQGSQRRRSIDELAEEAVTGFDEIGAQVEPEAEKADDNLRQDSLQRRRSGDAGSVQDMRNILNGGCRRVRMT